MDTKLRTLEYQVNQLVQRYREVLAGAGIIELPSTRQHLAVKHILKLVKPARLRARIRSLRKYHREERRFKKYLSHFSCELDTQEKRFDEDTAPRGAKNYGLDSSASDREV